MSCVGKDVVINDKSCVYNIMEECIRGGISQERVLLCATTVKVLK